MCDNADFVLLVYIDGQQTTTGAISNSDDITPNWKIEQTANIPDTASDSLAIQIMIRDSDDCGTAADCGNDADVTDRTSDRALNLQIDLSNCATSQAGAISGSISDNCNQKIISAGATGAGTENTAKIHFRIEVDSPGVAPGVFYPNPGQLWHPSLCLDDAICQSGDFDGDGKDDIVKFMRSTKGGNEEGDVWVSLSSGTQFGTASKWHEIFCSGEEICATGDFNGDGKDDIAAFVRSTKAEPSTGDVWVALSTGSGFGQQSVWHNFFCTDEEICKVGDFNGDGKDDVAKFIRSSKVEPSLGDVWVALSNGSRFEQPFPWHNSFCIGDATCSVGDFNGDGKADIASFTRSTKSDNEMGDVSVSLSKGDGFDTETL